MGIIYADGLEVREFTVAPEVWGMELCLWERMLGGRGADGRRFDVECCEREKRRTVTTWGAKASQNAQSRFRITDCQSGGSAAACRSISPLVEAAGTEVGLRENACRPICKQQDIAGES